MTMAEARAARLRDGLRRAVAILRPLCVVLCLAAFCAGCRTAAVSRPKVIHVVVSPRGVIYVEDRTTTIDALGKAVKKLDKDKMARVQIDVSTNTTDRVMRAIASQLAKSGYRNIHFQRPRRAELSVRP